MLNLDWPGRSIMAPVTAPHQATSNHPERQDPMRRTNFSWKARARALGAAISADAEAAPLWRTCGQRMCLSLCGRVLLLRENLSGSQQISTIHSATPFSSPKIGTYSIPWSFGMVCIGGIFFHLAAKTGNGARLAQAPPTPSTSALRARLARRRPPWPRACPRGRRAP